MQHNYKNKYGTELSVVKSKLSSNKLMAKILDFHKRKGRIDAYCHALEKYRHDGKEGPPWDVHGHSCEDIYVRWTPSLLELIPYWAGNTLNWIVESWEDSTPRKKKYPNPIYFLKTLKKYFDIYMANQSDYWVFVIDSFQSFAAGEVEEIAAEELGGWEVYRKMLYDKTSGSKRKELEAKAELKLNDKDFLIQRIERDYVRINSYLWVQADDPTVFIVDEKIRKFDLPTGWSEKYIIETLLVAWFYWLKDMRVNVRNVKD